MKRVDSLLADYASYHRTRGNICCHFVGIPLIIYGLLGLLREVPVMGPITGAEMLLVLTGVYYFVLDARLAILMLFSGILIDAVAYLVGDYRWALAAFLVGWIFQTIGHAIFEKKAPAFLKNLVHLLIGPIFLINELLHIRSTESPAY